MRHHFDEEVKMSDRLTKKKMLVLSDNREIARAIEVILKENAEISSLIVEPHGVAETSEIPQPLDLIIIVLSEQISEPVVALARVSLGHLLNQIPILIVSDKSFQPHRDAKIAHMEFPFTPDQLQTRVDEMLNGNLLGKSMLRRYQVKPSPPTSSTSFR